MNRKRGSVGDENCRIFVASVVRCQAALMSLIPVWPVHSQQNLTANELVSEEESKVV